MNKTPKGFRIHLGLFGRRNVGKSSLLNMITRQNAAIVSSYAGTTTDPIEKPMEFLPLGPVVFIDTAGIDDIGSLGQLRKKKTKETESEEDEQKAKSKNKKKKSKARSKHKKGS